MRRIGLAIVALFASLTTAEARDYAVVRARLFDVRFEGYPENGEVYVGSKLFADAQVVSVLYGDFKFRTFKVWAGVPDASPISDAFMIVPSDAAMEDSPFEVEVIPAKTGFCIGSSSEHGISADAIAALRSRFPCKQ